MCLDFFFTASFSVVVYNLHNFFLRVAYSKMAEEVSNLLLADNSEGVTCEIQLSCFNTVFSAPIPENLQSNHLHDAVSVFTSYLSEVAS